MKKFLLSVFVGIAVLSTLAAQNTDDPFAWKDQPQYSTYTIFNLGILPKIPGWQDRTETVGLKTGWPVVTGQQATMTGFECSWVYSGSAYMTGCQASMLMNHHLYGIGFQPAIVMNYSMKSFEGMQASCVFNYANNLRGVQAGALNIANYMVGFQPGVIGNITQKADGLQAGLFSITQKLDGCQLGGFNYAKDSSEGFQIGFFNIAKEKGLQFGFINIIPGGKLPFMILFNYSE